MRRISFPLLVMFICFALSGSLVTAQELVPNQPTPTARMPVAHLHVGFTKMTFCYGYLVVSEDAIAYEVQRSEEGQNAEKDKSHSFVVRPDQVEVVGIAALKDQYGPKGLEFRAKGKKVTLFRVSDWSTMEKITESNRPTIKSADKLLTAVKYPAIFVEEVKSAQQTAIPVQVVEEPPSTSSKTIALGQSPEQVEAALGKPGKVVDLGAKQIYIYKDLKVVFVDGKVADVQ